MLYYRAEATPVVSKKGLKKQQKEAEKVAKKHERQTHVEANGSTSTEGADDCSKGSYGILPMIQSKEKIDRALVNLKELTSDRADHKVWVRGRLHTSRAVGWYLLI